MRQVCLLRLHLRDFEPDDAQCSCAISFLHTHSYFCTTLARLRRPVCAFEKSPDRLCSSARLHIRILAHGRSPTDEFLEPRSPRWLHLRISATSRDRAATCLAGPSRWRSRSIASIVAAAATTVAWPLSPQGDGGRVTAWRPAIKGAELDSNPPPTHPPPLSPPSPPLLPLLPRAFSPLSCALFRCTFGQRCGRQCATSTASTRTIRAAPDIYGSSCARRCVARREPRWW